MEKKQFFAAYVPASAAAYCARLWEQHQFDLRIVRPRRTRLGDFTRKPHQRSRITLNANLNPYSFLITYLHEVAHHVVCSGASGVRRKVAPHGTEWKNAFRALLLPVLSEECFPKEILTPLKSYALNPRASTGSDPALVMALAPYSAAGGNKKTLMHLSEGANFVFQKREFTRGALRRTRVLCVETTSRRRYTIPAHALVEEC